MNVYSVKRLVSPEIEIKGKLLPYQDKVVFEPDEEDAIRIEIPIGKIKDVRFATEKDIDALRVAFFGIVTGIFWKKKHNILLIDFEDEYGITQHLTFEGDNDIEYAEKELYDIRKGGERNRELQPPLPEKSQLPENPEQKLYWKCPRCQGQNTLKAEFCTRCQFEKPWKRLIFNPSVFCAGENMTFDEEEDEDETEDDEDFDVEE